MNGCYIHTSESRYAMSDSLGCYSIPVTYGDEVDRVDSGGHGGRTIFAAYFACGGNNRYLCVCIR